MKTKYTILENIQKDLYIQDSPVIICAGQILKNNETNKILLQLKFKNISDQTIKALKVHIVQKDTQNVSLNNDIEYQYLDLRATRDEMFGQGIEIPCPNDNTRLVDLCVTEVIYTDNSSWNHPISEWEPIPDEKKLIDEFENPELVTQYKLYFGQRSIYKLAIYKDIWICSCGAINHKNEENCHICRNSLVEMYNCDMDALQQECNERLEQLRVAEEAKIEAKKAEKAKRKKHLKMGMICVVILLVITICINLLTAYLNHTNYSKAKDLMTNRQYNEAQEIFKQLNDYEDSEYQVKECIKMQTVKCE